MTHLRAHLLTLLSLLVAGGIAGADVVVYQQKSDFPVTGNPGIWDSQIDAPPNAGIGDYATAYDNFTLTNTTSISSLTWQGGYFDQGGHPFQGSITGFTIDFWANNGGQPPVLGSTPLASYTIPGTANETFVGTETATGNGGNLVYNYSTGLPTPFVAQSGVEYWLSIQANLTNPQWGWHTAVTGPGDGISYQDFRPDNTTPSQRYENSDLAFALLTPAASATVPEPASLALWSLFAGASGVVGWSRRRRMAR